jgi:hypothetical protein
VSEERPERHRLCSFNQPLEDATAGIRLCDERNDRVLNTAQVFKDPRRWARRSLSRCDRTIEICTDEQPSSVKHQQADPCVQGNNDEDESHEIDVHVFS